MALYITRSTRAIIGTRHLSPRNCKPALHAAIASSKHTSTNYPTKSNSQINIALAGTTALGLGSLWNLDSPTRSRGQVVSNNQDWELTDEIGTGAFGVVHRGIHRSTGEVGAIKTQKDQKHKASVQREIHALQKIKSKGGHKNIVELKGVYEKDGETCIVTEFVSGGELFDHVIKYGAFGEDEARSMLHDIVSAVAFLHGNGLIHKDLKPENVLLRFKDKRKENPAKIVDFGSAGPVSQVQDDIGTTVYLPPELLRRFSGEFTPAADVWAIGCILYVILTGMHPFDLEGVSSEKSIQQRIRKAKVSFKHDAAKDISPEAQDLIMQMLAKDPKKRPSAEQILQHPWMTAAENTAQSFDLSLSMLSEVSKSVTM